VVFLAYMEVFEGGFGADGDGRIADQPKLGRRDAAGGLRVRGWWFMGNLGSLRRFWGSWRSFW
jgi:hypothetical protein